MKQYFLALFCLVFVFFQSDLWAKGIPEDVFKEIVKKSDVKKLDSLVRKGYNVNEPLKKDPDSPEEYPITYAVSKNCMPVIQYLIGKRVNVNVEVEYDVPTTNRVINIAARSGNVPLVKLLVEAGAQLSWKSTIVDFPVDGIVCSFIARNNMPMVEYAFQHGAVANAVVCGGDACTYPLRIAIDNKNIKAIKFLLEHGADVNFRGPQKDYPLFGAIESNNVEIVALLLKHGADIHKEGYVGGFGMPTTPEQFAKEKGNKKIIQLLKSAK